MPTKTAVKAVKITGMTMGLMFGTMIAGAGLATAGWWYSDRLILNTGAPLSINETSTQTGDCIPGTTGENSYISENGKGTQSLKCVKDEAPIQRLEALHTKNGVILRPMFISQKVDDGEHQRAVLERIAVMINSTGPRWVVVRNDEKKVEKKVTPIKSTQKAVKKDK